MCESKAGGKPLFGAQSVPTGNLKGQLSKIVPAGQGMTIGPSLVAVEHVQNKRARLRVVAPHQDVQLVDAPGRDHQDLLTGAEVAFRDCLQIGPVRLVITDVGASDVCFVVVRGTLPRDWRVAVGPITHAP